MSWIFVSYTGSGNIYGCATMEISKNIEYPEDIKFLQEILGKENNKKPDDIIILFYKHLLSPPREDKRMIQDELQELVDRQAEDEGLWFISRTAPEAYLQQELRKLHQAIEERE